MKGFRKIRIDSLRGREHQFPQRWEDLSPVQYIEVVGLIAEYMQGNMPLTEFQFRIYIQLAGINDRKLLKKDYAWMEKHIFENVGKMSFVYKIVYKDERYDLLSDKMKRRLEKIMPEEVNDPEATLASRFDRDIEIDMCFAKQLVPKLYSRMRSFVGYRFDTSSGVLVTSLVANQYIDAINILDQYAKTKESLYLDMLISVLYTNSYDSDKALSQLEKFTRIPEFAKVAVMLNFQAIIAYLTTKTKYKLLFSTAENKPQKSLLGMSAILYSLVEKGYGSIEKVGAIGLIAFFDLMLKNLSDAAQQMHASKMKKSEIAERLNIKIEALEELL